MGLPSNSDSSSAGHTHANLHDNERVNDRLWERRSVRLRPAESSFGQKRVSQHGVGARVERSHVGSSAHTHQVFEQHTLPAGVNIAAAHWTGSFSSTCWRVSPKSSRSALAGVRSGGTVLLAPLRSRHAQLHLVNGPRLRSPHAELRLVDRPGTRAGSDRSKSDVLAARRREVPVLIAR